MDRYDLTMPETHNFFANGVLIHNTSGRAGNLPVDSALHWAKRWWNNFAGSAGLPQYSTSKYMYVSGTRNVVRNPLVELHENATPDFRARVDDELRNLGIHQGETLFFEIVGFKGAGSPIMNSHGVKDKILKKKYGSEMIYSYGCDRDQGNYKILVYRITQQGHHGDTVELSQQQLQRRCDTLGLTVVPMLEGPFVYNGDLEALQGRCEELSKGCSTLDDKHIREGVVVRIEGQRSTAMKYKGYWFAHLEGIKKNDDTYVDPEEVS